MKATFDEPIAKMHDLDCEVREGCLEEVTYEPKNERCVGVNKRATGRGKGFQAEQAA